MNKHSKTRKNRKTKLSRRRKGGLGLMNSLRAVRTLSNAARLGQNLQRKKDKFTQGAPDLNNLKATGLGFIKKHTEEARDYYNKNKGQLKQTIENEGNKLKADASKFAGELEIRGKKYGENLLKENKDKLRKATSGLLNFANRRMSDLNKRLKGGKKRKTQKKKGKKTRRRRRSTKKH